MGDNQEQTAHQQGSHRGASRSRGRGQSRRGRGRGGHANPDENRDQANIDDTPKGIFNRTRPKDHNAPDHKDRPPKNAEERIQDAVVDFVDTVLGFGFAKSDNKKYKFNFTGDCPVVKDQVVKIELSGRGRHGVDTCSLVTDNTTNVQTPAPQQARVYDPVLEDMRDKLHKVMSDVYRCDVQTNSVSFKENETEQRKTDVLIALQSHLSRERYVANAGQQSAFSSDLDARKQEIAMIQESLTRELNGIHMLQNELIPQVRVAQPVVPQVQQPAVAQDTTTAVQQTPVVKSEQQQIELPEAQQLTKEQIDQRIAQVQSALKGDDNTPSDIVKAVETFSTSGLRPQQVPNDLLCDMYQSALEGVPIGTSTPVPERVRTLMIKTMSDAMYFKKQEGKYCQDLYDQQRKLCIMYSQRFNLRRYEYMVSILRSIVDNCPVAVFKTLPRIKGADYLSLQKAQTYLSALLVGAPRNCYKTLKAYVPIKSELLAEERTRSNALRIASIKSHSKNNQAPTEQINLNDFVKDEQEEQQAPAHNGTLQTFTSTASVNLSDPANSSVPTPIQQLAPTQTTDLNSQIMNLFRALEPTADEIEKKNQLSQEVQGICLKTFEDNKCTVYTYGSSLSGFGLSGSDIDTCIMFENDVKDAKMQTQLLKLVEKGILDALDKNEYGHLSCKEERGVTRARVPVLKIVDSRRSFECDICINNFLGVVNTRMLRLYSQFDERVRPLVYAVKYWAKRRHINDPPSGSLSSYSHVLMVIHYLQQINILPSLQDLINHEQVDPSKHIPQPHYWNAYDTRYVGSLQVARSIFYAEHPKNESLTVGDLLTGYYKYYGEFDFDKNYVSINNVSAHQNGTAQKITGAPISIQDPFEQRELGGVVSSDMAPKMLAEWKRAHELITQHSLSNIQLLEMICEERENVQNEGNIYQQRQDYDDHLTIEQVNQGLENGTLVRGTLRVNKRRFREAYVTNPAFERDILIDGHKARNRALHGDIVAVTRPEGDSNSSQIVAIIEKKSPTYFACYIMKEDLKKEQDKFRWMIPIDKSYPKLMVFYEEFMRTFREKGSDLEDLVFVCEINQPWKQAQHSPRCRIMGTLGLRKDMWSQKRAILLQQVPVLWNDVIARQNKPQKNPLGFDRDEESSKPTNIEITEQVLQDYEDYRNTRIFTIDPTTSRDLDDALSITKLENGNYLIGVYIADVDKFVKEGDPVDMEARRRGTSVYMIDSVEHMLDPSLSQNLASLHGGVTRYSLCVEFIMNEQGALSACPGQSTAGDEGNVGRFKRVIIKSCCRLDYDQAQLIITGKDTPTNMPIVHDQPQHSFDQIKQDVLDMNRLAQVLRKKRKSGNSLFLSNREMRFKMDSIYEGGTGYPVEFAHEEHNESHQLVEEFMLIANQLAAKALVNHYPDDALLRNHSTPDREKWTNTISKMTHALMNTYQVDASDPIVSSILQQLDSNDPNVPVQNIMNQVVQVAERFGNHVKQTAQHSLMREMQLAKYCKVSDVESTMHFALNMIHYTHFTSPIRRYADVIVHRMLLQMLRDQKSGQRGPMDLRGEKLTELADHLNDQAYRAKTAQETAQRAYLSFYLIPHLRHKVERIEAVIISLGRRSFTCYVPKYCIEINVQIMGKFEPEPDMISSRDVNNVVQLTTGDEPQQQQARGGGGDDENTKVVIEEVTLSWHHGVRPDIKLSAMKKVLLDLDVNYEIMPYDVYAYAVWDANEPADVKVADRSQNVTADPLQTLLDRRAEDAARLEDEHRREARRLRDEKQKEDRKNHDGNEHPPRGQRGGRGRRGSGGPSRDRNSFFNKTQKQ